jgi:hypothetical protein
MAFHCTFLFSDPAEFELLVGKILTEGHLVDKWFIVEGAFSFKGEYKGLRLKSLLENEVRLKSYLHRIRVFEVHKNHIKETTAFEKISDFVESAGRKILKKDSGQIRRARLENKYFEVEKYSRDVPTQSIVEETAPSDWLFITDVDEVVNLSSEKIRSQLLDVVGRGSKFLQIQRRRYVFDFDNLDPRFRTIPLIKIEILNSKSNLRISSFRFMSNGETVLFERPPVVEFSYCFKFTDIKQKLQDFAHLAPPDSSIRDALMYNHHLRYMDDADTNYFWFMTDYSVDEFIPEYFKKNLSELKTNSVNPEYTMARAHDFPLYFGNGEEFK